MAAMQADTTVPGDNVLGGDFSVRQLSEEMQHRPRAQSAIAKQRLEVCWSIYPHDSRD